jgi:hypothetical protein
MVCTIGSATKCTISKEKIVLAVHFLFSRFVVFFLFHVIASSKIEL